MDECVDFESHPSVPPPLNFNTGPITALCTGIALPLAALWAVRCTGSLHRPVVGWRRSPYQSATQQGTATTEQSIHSDRAGNSMWELQVQVSLNPADWTSPSESYWLTGPLVRIGRPAKPGATASGTKPDIIISGDSAVSKVHAELHQQGGTLRIKGESACHARMHAPCHAMTCCASCFCLCRSFQCTRFLLLASMARMPDTIYCGHEV